MRKTCGGNFIYETIIRSAIIMEEDDLKKKSLSKKLQKQRVSVEKLPKSFAFRKK